MVTALPAGVVDSQSPPSRCRRASRRSTLRSVVAAPPVKLRRRLQAASTAAGWVTAPGSPAAVAGHRMYAPAPAAACCRAAAPATRSLRGSSLPAVVVGRGDAELATQKE